MASITSNRTVVTRALFGLSQAMNLRRNIPGRSKRLGDELLETVAGAIEDRTVNRQLQPDGSPLPRLRPRTIARKIARGLDTRILIETHEMLSMTEIMGRTDVAGNMASMTGGTDDDVRFKIEKAEEGGANRPARHFYEAGKDGEKVVDVLIEETLAAAVKAAEQL